jgi:hypothetical protein
MGGIYSRINSLWPVAITLYQRTTSVLDIAAHLLHYDILSAALVLRTPVFLYMTWRMGALISTQID